MKEIGIKYGITIRIDAKGPGIYIQGHSVESTMDILAKDGNLYDEMKWNAIDILRKAQECNAGLCEIQSIHREGKLRIYFEFESWEYFLEFKKMMEEHSRQ